MNIVREDKADTRAGDKFANPSPSGDSFVTISNITKHFADFAALDGVSFSVREGGTLALLGPSGCGKTTMLRCLAGLETPGAGTISIAGRVVFDASTGINLMPEQRGLGVVFQSYAVWPHMTVAENVAFPLRVRGVRIGDRRVEALRILEIVGLAGFADRPATDLSGGQQQRVALARALIHSPSLVLFDEALSNLDAQLREQMRLELKTLQDRLGFTAIYVTHDQGEALGLAESIVLMNAGRVETSGSARDVFSTLHSSFAARFFGLNVIEAELVRIDAASGRAIFRCGAATVGTSIPALPIRPGDRVFVAFRRERVRLLARASAATAPDNGSLLPGRIVTSSFQGLLDEYVIDLGDGVSARSIQTAMNLQRGQEVDVVIQQEDLIVLHR
jgi:iron(III) transport system ATP-binding protein